MAPNPDFRIQFTPEFIYMVAGEEPPLRRSPPPPPSRGLRNPRVPPLLPRHHALPPPSPFVPKGEQQLPRNEVESVEKLPKETKADEVESRLEEASVKADEKKVTEHEQLEKKPVDEGSKPRDLEAHGKVDGEEKQVNLVSEEKPADKVARDLQPLQRILERNDKRGEELRKTGLQELEAMSKRAEELKEKKYFNTGVHRTLPCLAEKEECINCYQTKDAARCKREAEAYIRCTSQVFKSAVS